MKDNTILDEAKKVIWGDREKTYGKPEVNMERIAGFWSIIFGHPVTVEQACLGMAAVKMSRLVHNPDHRDSQVDLCGYTALLERIEEAAPKDCPELKKFQEEFKEELKQRYPDPKNTGLRYVVQAENHGTPMYALVNPDGKRGWTESMAHCVQFESYNAAADEAIIALNKMAFGKYPGFPYGPITVRTTIPKKAPETHKDEIS